ncbi:MAG: hypothetical protein JWQ34_3143 [Mucilaginibacter sp.]|nr:hypothetical protein [Mucilaginibacter sp.]
MVQMLPTKVLTNPLANWQEAACRLKNGAKVAHFGAQNASSAKSKTP